METIAVYAIVGLAALGTIVGLLGKKRSPSCGSGCRGCASLGSPQALVNIRRR